MAILKFSITWQGGCWRMLIMTFADPWRLDCWGRKPWEKELGIALQSHFRLRPLDLLRSCWCHFWIRHDSPSRHARAAAAPQVLWALQISPSEPHHCGTTIPQRYPKIAPFLLLSLLSNMPSTSGRPPTTDDHRTSHQHGPGRKRQVLLDLRHPWTSPLPHQWKVAQVTRNAADLHGMGTGTLSVKFLGWFSSRVSTYYPETSIQNCCQSFAPLIFDWGGTES